MDRRTMWSSASVLVLVVILGTIFINSTAAWGSNDPGKVLLKDVQVLTLKAGQMTTGRRSSPVSQLNCVGGSAKGQFNPQVVQCYNRGWDGQDVQWECKSDMDNLYRFGSVEVICEGYDYPDDPYILKGSCGLEYTLELTKEGNNRQSNSANHDYGYGSSNNYNSGYNYSSKNKWSGMGDLVVFGVVCFVIYALYKTCIDTPDNQTMGDRQYSSTNDDYPGGSPGGGGWFGGGNNQRPNNYGTGNNPAGFDDASCGGPRQRRGGTGGGGGFWSGMATGGLLGYMFGGNNRGYGGYGGYQRPRTGWGWGGNTGYARSTSGFGGFSGGSAGGGSSGTRTASGFGGTRRR